MRERGRSGGLLSPRLRSQVRDWADRRPRRVAGDAATLAREVEPRRRRIAAVLRPRLLWGALAAGVVVLAIALALPSGRNAGPAPGASATPAAAAETRVVVIELASGTSLYVVLPPPAARRSS